MRLLSILAYYFWWHYTIAIEDLVQNYLNLFKFLNNFFSVGHLTRNIFAPWKRLGEQYSGHFELANFFSALIVNTLMRLVGFCIRIVVIVIALICILVSLFLFFVSLAVWLILPVITLILFILGFKLLLS